MDEMDELVELEIQIAKDVLKQTAYEAFKEKYDVEIDPFRVCVQRLRGNSCRGEKCECLPPGSDHSFMALRNRKAVALITQPYDMNLDTMRKVVKFCDHHGLDVRISGWPSWHNPNDVFTVVYTLQQRRPRTLGRR